MSKLNQQLYQMLQIATSNQNGTIKRTGNAGAVIVSISISNRYEDWLFREFPDTQTAEAYLRSVGRIEDNLRIEEKKWYRPADKDLAWDFDIGAGAYLEQFFPRAYASLSKQFPNF